MRASFLLTVLFSAFLPFLAAAGKALNPRAAACNNSPSLCSRSYGEITHLGCHDSAFVRQTKSSDGVSAANQ